MNCVTAWSGAAFTRARATDVDHAAERQRRIVDQVVLQRPAHGHGTFDKREVGLLHRLRSELRSERLEGCGRARDEDEPRGVSVDPVQRTGHERLVTHVAHVEPVGDNAVHQRARLAVGKRLHGLCGGLVEGEQRRVLEHAPHVYCWIRSNAVVARLGEAAYMDALAALQFLSLDGGAAVHRDVSIRTGRATERARGSGEAGQQGGIQTDAACFHDEVCVLNHVDQSSAQAGGRGSPTIGSSPTADLNRRQYPRCIPSSRTGWMRRAAPTAT